MSSLRNAVQRRNHRERGQPEERAKWGLLEKKKDYSARARDFNSKKSKLRALRQKVVEKNPDEFYFGMMSRKGPSASGKNSTGTVNGDRGNQVLSQEASKLYKTQDLGYIRTMRNTVAKEVEDLERRSNGIVGHGKKIVFVEDQEEQVQRLQQQEEEEEFGIDGDDDDFEDEADPQDLRRKKLKIRLSLARERLRALADAEDALSLQRAKMAKSPSVGGLSKHGVKFKVRERKR